MLLLPIVSTPENTPTKIKIAPYGVREGARKVGKKQKTIERNRPKPKPEDMRNPHIVQCIPYSLTDMLRDLLKFASQTLVMGGRLVYWLPTTIDYKDSDLPRHPCLEMVANCEQPLSRKIRRRLITMQKISEYDPLKHENLSKEELGQINAAHTALSEIWMNRTENKAK